MKIIVALLCVLGLAACGSQGSDSTSKKDPPRTIPGPSDLQIAFEWSGGFVGRDDRLDIRPDGAARLTHRNGAIRFQLSPAELAKLRTLIGAADIKNAPQPKAPQGVADGFLYAITYDGTTISWGDGGDPPPPRVGELGVFLSD